MKLDKLFPVNACDHLQQAGVWEGKSEKGEYCSTLPACSQAAPDWHAKLRQAKANYTGVGT